MKTKLKALIALSLFFLLTFSLSLVVLAGTATENDSLHSNDGDSLTPGGVGLLMTTISVSTTIDGLNDGDGLCSLREAIAAANNDAPVDGGACPAGSPGHDTIIVPAGLYLLTDTVNTDLDITSTLTIQGAGAGSTIIDDGPGVFLRMFDIKSSGVATISNVTVNGGDSGFGGGIRNQGILWLIDSTVSNNQSTNNGGGIYNDVNSDLTVTDSIITGNEAAIAGGGIFNADGTVTINNSQISNNTSITTSTAGVGGGIANSAGSGTATMTINQSSITTNTVNGGGGGGLINQNGTMNLVNSTVSGNAATGGTGLGGGLANSSFGIATTLWLSNTTITGNTASSAGGALVNLKGSASATTNFRNTIIAGGCSNGVPGFPVTAGTLTSLGYNMDDGNTCGLTDPTDFTNTNPVLGPLQNNTGDTETHALLSTSPAIDAGICSGAPTTDQRGQPRPNAISAFCDIGAYESSLLGSADLQITKTVNLAQPSPGQSINYTLTFINNGPAGASGVAITDVVPISLTNVTSSSTGVPLAATPGITFSWTVGDLARGAGGVITIIGQISSSVAVSDTFTNTAEITGTNSDGDTDSNSSQVSVTIGDSGTTTYLPIVVKN